jgi:hypothetical protein
MGSRTPFFENTAVVFSRPKSENSVELHRRIP